MFLETIGGEPVLLRAKVSSFVPFLTQIRRNKFSNLSLSYLFINHDRACWDQLRSERREQTPFLFLSLADFDSIIAPDVTAAFNERLPESSPPHILPTRAGDRNQRETERMVVTVEGA